MPQPRTPRTGRSLTRRLLLGSGPLKRTSDRLHALSRLGVFAAVLAAIPVAVVVGLAVASLMRATAAAQAAARTQHIATLLADAPAAASSDDGEVPATAGWTGPSGRFLTGTVLAPGGAAAGTRVTVWLDDRGQVTEPPLTDGDVTAEGATAGLLTAIALPTLAALVHLCVVHQLDRARLRRWTAEWASVEPLWAGRTG